MRDRQMDSRNTEKMRRGYKNTGDDSGDVAAQKGMVAAARRCKKARNSLEHVEGICFCQCTDFAPELVIYDFWPPE